MSLEHAVLDALPNTIYTVDAGGAITSVNRAWLRFAEANGAPHLADSSQVVGSKIWDAISGAAPRAQIERAMELLRTGRAPSVSWEFPCDSPTEERIFLMQVAALRDTSGAINGFVFSTIDITPSHRSREALLHVGTALSGIIELDRVFSEVSNQLRRAIPYDGFVIALLDDGSGEMKAAHRTGFDAAPVDARALEEALRPRWLAALANARVMTEETTSGLELTAPMTSVNGVLGAMTIITDSLEDRQRREEAERVLMTIAAQTAVAIERAGLVRRVEEKRRLEAIGEVAAGIAHELRNPLFGISSAAQLLRFRSQQDPVVERNVGRILREVERLNGMVTDLLEFGRPRPLSVAPADPDDVWDEVLEGNRGLLESKSLALHRKRAADAKGATHHPKPRPRIDSERIAQVFLNVLVNAVDAAPPGSDVTLTSSITPSGGWRCTLNNGGAPIAPEALPRVFEIFFSNKQGGTGIGLALCQRVIDEHGGTIAIESNAARGTTVIITLPGATTGASSATSTRQPAAHPLHA